ncbi:hypothetical protein C5O00_04885 [Pukyongia salina]|uniref:Uncharacterized protein n=1 Tax=Pukyongia salina TaxID=2094025 RepID=A0A2S0HV95_9FLAO|nr:hypothetical protein C5O00_04885 [Pukyongia salina]
MPLAIRHYKRFSFYFCFYPTEASKIVQINGFLCSRTLIIFIIYKDTVMQFKVSDIFYKPRLSTIIIISLFAVGVILNLSVEQYRYSEFRWIYKYVKLISIIMTFGSIGWSLLHPIIIWSENKVNWKSYLLWIFLGMLPILYFTIMIIILNLTGAIIA